jgi:hypothetical protein
VDPVGDADHFAAPLGAIIYTFWLMPPLPPLSMNKVA